MLHIEDMPLVYEGHVLFSNLVTLRKGELAYDDVKSCLTPLKDEVIKIAGTMESTYNWHCVFHGEGGCNLHPLRPAQCAALFCKDTSQLEAMYKHNLASREHVLAKAPAGWAELARAHAEECSLQVLADLINDIHNNKSEILQMLRYDITFRELCIQKAHMPADVLNCVLGRELGQFLRSFGYVVQGENIVKKGNNFHKT